MVLTVPDFQRPRACGTGGRAWKASKGRTRAFPVHQGSLGSRGPGRSRKHDAKSRFRHGANNHSGSCAHASGRRGAAGRKRYSDQRGGKTLTRPPREGSQPDDIRTSLMIPHQSKSERGTAVRTPFQILGSTVGRSKWPCSGVCADTPLSSCCIVPR